MWIKSSTRFNGERKLEEKQHSRVSSESKLKNSPNSHVLNESCFEDKPPNCVNSEGDFDGKSATHENSGKLDSQSRTLSTATVSRPHPSPGTVSRISKDREIEQP